MKLLANENFPLSSVLFLRNAGYNVLYVGERLKSISDKTVLQMTIEEERTILTFDRDYGELIFRFQIKPPKGVIYLRLINYLPHERGQLIHQLFQNALKTENMLTVFDGATIRQKVYSASDNTEG